MADVPVDCLWQNRDLTDVVLVGHSFGGVTVPRVMALPPDRIRHVVLLSAVVPENGARVLDQIDPDVRVSVEAGIAGGVYTVGLDAARYALAGVESGRAAAGAGS